MTSKPTIEKWHRTNIDLEIAYVLDTPADSDRSPYNSAVYRAWIVGHEHLTTAYGDSPKAAQDRAKEAASLTACDAKVAELRALLDEANADIYAREASQNKLQARVYAGARSMNASNALRSLAGIEAWIAAQSSPFLADAAAHVAQAAHEIETYRRLKG